MRTPPPPRLSMCLRGDELSTGVLVEDVLTRAAKRLEEDVFVYVGSEVQVGQESIGRRGTAGSEETREYASKGEEEQHSCGEADNADYDTSDFTSGKATVSSAADTSGVRALPSVSGCSDDDGGAGKTSVVATLVLRVASCALAPVAFEGTSYGRVRASDSFGGTDAAIGDAGAVNHAVGLKFAFAVLGVADRRPANRGQRNGGRAVLATGVDAITVLIAVVAVARVVIEGAVTASGTVDHDSGQTDATLAFADGTFGAGSTRVLGVSRGKRLEVFAGVVLVEVIQDALTVYATELRALDVTVR